MLTVIDLDAAMLAAQAQAAEWEADFQARWNGPLLQAQAVMEFLSLSPAEQDEMRSQDPEAFAGLARQVARMKGVMTNGPRQ